MRAVHDATVALEGLLHPQHKALLDAEATALFRQALQALRSRVLERAQAQEAAEAAAMAEGQRALAERSAP